MFHRLVAYKLHHGACNVPDDYPHDKALGKWVQWNRQRLRHAPLNNVRRQQLDSIGFLWKTGVSMDQGEMERFGEKWNEMFQRLIAYKEKHGDCNTPYSYCRDKALGKWVCHQRSALKNAPLNDPKRRQLVSIGFVWKNARLDWDEMFEKVVAFRNLHGHCKVTRTYSKDRQLIKWVENQSRRLVDAPLDNVRRMKLDSIGFPWKGGICQQCALPGHGDSEVRQQDVACSNSQSDEENCHALSQGVETSRLPVTKLPLQKDAPVNEEQRRALENIGFRFQDTTERTASATTNYQACGQARAYLVQGISGVYFRESF